MWSGHSYRGKLLDALQGVKVLIRELISAFWPVRALLVLRGVLFVPASHNAAIKGSSDVDLA